MALWHCTFCGQWHDINKPCPKPKLQLKATGFIGSITNIKTTGGTNISEEDEPLNDFPFNTIENIQIYENGKRLYAFCEACLSYISVEQGSITHNTYYPPITGKSCKATQLIALTIEEIDKRIDQALLNRKEDNNHGHYGIRRTIRYIRRMLGTR
jgi:hypothetical protein